jgi:tetratricopeptide (TPR) repeat protein
MSWALAYQQPPDPAAAEEAARKSISLQASLIGAHYHLGRALMLQSRFEEAKAAFIQSKNLDPNFGSADFGLAQVCIAQGEYREALEYLNGLGEIAKSPVVPVQAAIAYEALGDRDRALEAVERALSNGYRDIEGLGQIPEFKSLREDPQYLELLDRSGLSGSDR